MPQREPNLVVFQEKSLLKMKLLGFKKLFVTCRPHIYTELWELKILKISEFFFGLKKCVMVQRPKMQDWCGQGGTKDVWNTDVPIEIDEK